MEIQAPHTPELSMDEPIESQMSMVAIAPAGEPDDRQMALINQYSPLGELSTDEVVTVPFYASNNLLWHSNGAWTIPSLSAMAELLKGRKFILDHNWYSVESSVGKIYDAQLLYSEDAPDHVIDVAGMKENNEYIVHRNGYARLILHAYFEKSSPAVSGFKYGRLDDVSTGVLADPDGYICPICTERFGRDIHFNEKDADGYAICPHDIPSYWMTYWFGDDPDFNFAPFYYRDGVKHGVELSAVVVPDLPLAGVITPNRMKYVI